MTAFKTDKKKNDKLIMKRFDEFIKQKKEFGDDVFSVIKDFMIEPIYKKSYKMIQQREVRYNPCCVDATTFFIGRRHRNLIQVKMIRNGENEIIENPQFKFYKIQTLELKNAIDKTDVILMEYVDIKCCADEDPYDGSVMVCYYMIGADKHKNELWTDEDDKTYEIKMNELRERNEADYQDYIDDIEAMM